MGREPVTEIGKDLFGQPIRDGQEAYDQEQFEAWIVERYLAKSSICSVDAEGFASAFFDPHGLALVFGHPDYGWTKSDAYDLADEDMSYWEGD